MRKTHLVHSFRMKTYSASQLSALTVGVVIQSLTSVAGVARVQRVGIVPFVFATGMISNRAFVFCRWSPHKTAAETRGEPHAEQKLSPSGQRGEGWESLIARFVSVEIAHLTGSGFKGAEVLNEPYSTQWQKSSEFTLCVSFILIFLLPYIMGTVKKRSMSFLSLF